MAGRMAGKVALVTGAASGLGAAQALLFAREGARVVVADIQEAASARVVDSIRAEGGDALFVRLDVVDEAGWDAAVALCLDRFGLLTTLVNNAGIFRPGGVRTTTPEGWNQVIEINQTGLFLGMHKAADALTRSGNGAIVNISSVYGVAPSPDALAYHASKSAVRMMSRAAAFEFARQKIRVNTILPGRIETPIAGDMDPAQVAVITGKIPMNRIGDPMDIAYASLYLASDEARYVSGAEILVDGGWYAGAGSLLDVPGPLPELG